MSLIIELIPDTDEGGFTARLPDIPAYGGDPRIADTRIRVRDSVSAGSLSHILTPQVNDNVRFKIAS